MIQIMCVLEPEDYSNLHSMDKNGVPLRYHGYVFEVEGGGETEGSGKVRALVFELLNASIALGIAIPLSLSLDGEFRFRFISPESPMDDVSLICNLSQEIKRASYMGDDDTKLEYVGFSLERFYESKGAKFYFYDLRASIKPDK